MPTTAKMAAMDANTKAPSMKKKEAIMASLPAFSIQTTQIRIRVSSTRKAKTAATKKCQKAMAVRPVGRGDCMAGAPGAACKGIGRPFRPPPARISL